MQVQMRPLHRSRYGVSAYDTHDRLFTVRRNGRTWRVSRSHTTDSIAAQIRPTGIFITRFPRRKDAIAALEAVLEGVES